MTPSNKSPEKNGKSQEKIAGALGAVFFFAPALMNQKTEFTLFYMRQSFLVVLVQILLGILGGILGSIVGILGTICSLLTMVLGFGLLFLAWKAYSGEKFAIPYLYDYSVKVIKILKLDGFFSVK